MSTSRYLNCSEKTATTIATIQLHITATKAEIITNPTSKIKVKILFSVDILNYEADMIVMNKLK